MLLVGSLRVPLERAAADAPSLRARAAGVSAAQSAAIAADRLPDPTLDVGIQDFPVTGPDAGTLNRDNFTMLKIGLSQQFVNPAKRRARAARASAEIGIAETAALAETWNVRLQTALAWIDLYYAERRALRRARWPPRCQYRPTLSQPVQGASQDSRIAG